MRISQSMMKTTLINDVDAILRRLANLHHQASTGKKFEFPSENPAGAFLVSSYDSTMRQLSSYKSSLDQVNGNFKGYGSMLSQLTSSIQRVHALVVQASNDTNTSADRKAIADEVKRIREFIVQLGNTKIGSSYLFSGSKSQIPITVSGSGENATYFYVSNSATSSSNMLRVGTSVIKTNLTLPEVFNYTGGDTSNSLLSYKSYGGTTTTNLILTGGAETLEGSVKIDLDTGSLSINNGIINGTLNRDASVSLDGTTQVIVNGQVSGSVTTISSGSTFTIIGGTVTLNLTGSGSTSELNLASSDIKIFNASGSSATVVSNDRNTDSNVKIGLLDKIIDDLSNNNINEIRGADLGDIEKYESALERVTSNIGSREQISKDLINSNENFNSYITQLLSKTQDADMVKVISDISMQQNVYQAALESSAKALLPTLADFLR